MQITAIGSATPEQILTHEHGEVMQRRMLARMTTEPISDLLNLLVKHVYRGEDNVQRHCVALKYHESLLEDIDPEAQTQSTSTERRMELYAKEALPLTLRSIARLPTGSDGDDPKFSHIVYVSCTGQAAPGVSVGIVEHLSQATPANILEINFFGGCAGLLVGLKVARDIIDANASNRVLLCATELCSLHFKPTQSNQQVIVNSIFADGSVSLICESETLAAIPQAEAARAWRHIASTTYLMPDTKEMITWDLGGAGFVMGLSPALPRYIESHLKGIIQDILADQGLSIDDISHWALHPGGPKILDACQNALSLSDDQIATSWQIYRMHGNMSSTTIGFILEQIRLKELVGYCVAIAFAPGVRMEVAILHD